MTLKEFNNLDFEEKILAVVDNGIFIDNYVTLNIKMNLYGLDKFYVELVYDGVENKLREVRSFKGGLLLSKYTYHVNLKNHSPEL